MPGWTYSTGINELFLEAGQPFGIPRYFDGRQAVCLNGDGKPVFVSQTLETVIGQDYKLSFALSEEQIARPSPASVLVKFGTLTEAFDLGATTGYAVFDVKTKEEAVEWTMRFMDLHRQHWPEWEGESEVRQMFEGPGCPDSPPCTP